MRSSNITFAFWYSTFHLTFEPIITFFQIFLCNDFYLIYFTMNSPSPENKSSNQEIKISHHNTASKSTVHLLPCKVECEGVEGCSSAKVDTYFAPVIRATNETIHLSTAKGCDGKPNQVYTATFRGRRLKGVNIAIPDGLTGVMLRELNQSHGDEVCVAYIIYRLN